jgi:hypothetical protein
VKAAEILARFDKGQNVATIAEHLSVTKRYVQMVLHKDRPNRPKPGRPKRSDVPRMVVGLYGQNIKPARIAAGLGISRQYVYRILSGRE